MNAGLDEVQGAFRALADPSRRSILMHLSKQEMTIGEISSRFEMTRAAVKKHLIILEEGRLISTRTSGRERINRLEPLAIKQAADWLNYFSEFWDTKLEKLQDAVNAAEREKND